MVSPESGAFKLAAVHNMSIPAAFRRERGWYEEDVDAAIPMFFMPLLFNPDEVRNARQSLRNWHWQAWETHFREIVPLADSPCKAQALFIADYTAMRSAIVPVEGALLHRLIAAG
jgi:hypothetical protein